MLKINIEIALNDDEQYSSLEAAVVRALQGDAEWPPAAAPAAEVKAEPAKAAPKAAPKAAAKPAARSTRAAVLEDDAEDEAAETEEPAEETPAPAKPAARKPAPKAKPTPAPAEDAEDDSEDAAEGGMVTLEEAVAAASELISSGQSPKVKAALASAGVKKVSELKGDQIAEFVAALEA